MHTVLRAQEPELGSVNAGALAELGRSLPVLIKDSKRAVNGLGE